MEQMIKSAMEMRGQITQNERYQFGYRRAINSVMEAIERANAKCQSKTVFHPQWYWYKDENGRECHLEFDDEVKTEFKKYGYTFQPIGYIGGVLQRGEYICW